MKLKRSLIADVTGGVAKGAQVDLVLSQSTEVTNGLQLSIEYVVDNNLAPVLSVSFQGCQTASPAESLYFNAVWEQAAAQGITVAVSAGDNGSANCDAKGAAEASHGLAVNGIAATPFNVAVGGTDFNDVGSQSLYWKSSGKITALSYIPEVPWNNSCAAAGLSGCSGSPTASTLTIFAGGGGHSSCLGGANPDCSKPAWQSGFAVAGAESLDGSRDIPDISLFSSAGSSSNSAYAICESDLNNKDALCPPFQFNGGTSASAPAFAGIMAMVNQYMLTQGGDGRQGNANYVLYPLASQQINAGTLCASADVATGNACTFYDVTGGYNAVPCVANSANCSELTTGSIGVLVDSNGNPAWSAHAGYDLATGLGTINVANLVHAWPAAVGAFRPSGTTLQLCAGTPQVCVSGGGSGTLTIAHGSSVNVNIFVSPTPPASGEPTGDAALVATPNTLSANGGASSAGAIQFSSSQTNGILSLTGGKAAITTNTLVGGSYQLSAHYSGDGIFGASDSLPLNVTVSPENSTTSLTLATVLTSQPLNRLPSGQSVGYGTPVLLHVAVSGTNRTTQASPTGTLTITDNGSPFDGGTFTLNSEGFAEIQTGLGPLPALPVGRHSFQVSYGGDNSYSASQTGSSTTLSITPAGTNLTVISNPASVLAGKIATLTATVTTPSTTVGSAGLAPTGTVTFLSNGTPILGNVFYKSIPGEQSGLGEPEAAASLAATLYDSPTSTATITASYSGDANYLPSNYSTSSATDSAVLTVVPYQITATNISTSNPVIIPAPGQQGAENLVVQLGTGTTSLALGCSVGPTTATGAPTCGFSNSTITKSGLVTLVLNTVAPSRAVSRRFTPFGPLNPPLSFQVPVVLAIILVGVVSLLRRRYVWLLASVLLLVTLCATCGTASTTKPTSGTSSLGTAPGVYTVTAYGLQSGSPPVTVYFQVE